MCASYSAVSVLAETSERSGPARRECNGLVGRDVCRSNANGKIESALVVGVYAGLLEVVVIVCVCVREWYIHIHTYTHIHTHTHIHV